MYVCMYVYTYMYIFIECYATRCIITVIYCLNADKLRVN